MNLRYISKTLHGTNEPKTIDYQNILSIIKKMPNIQIVSASVFGAIIGGFIMLGISSNVDATIEAQIKNVLLHLLFPSIIIVFFSTIQMMIPPVKKNLDLYMSKAWIMSIKSESSEFEKITIVMNCFEEYDDFLQKSLNQRINDLDEYFKDFVLDKKLGLGGLIQKIKDNFGSDEFSLLRFIESYKNENQNSETPLLIKKSTNIRTKISSDKLTVIVVAVLTFVGIVLKESFPWILKIFENS